ncbi:NADPH-dependent F420 reductase [Glycomyces sp. YM15]|uniref:NADPH-dependent F420 reductase n=1 Tax=Glycomyces sp. YM15 TaxID=2800446 RepID=UPI00196242DF|nr:NAD(P)-binding domain-containing protein [Glycomyces sp. YM15]
MKIAVLGTGSVGRALAGRFAELGHEVAVGTRDPAATLARGDYAAWAAERPGIALAAFADAAAGAEVVVNASSGAHSLAVLASVGEANLAGKVLLDVANEMTPSDGLPLVGANETASLGERIQRAFPSARVVKTLNTMNFEVMANPALVAGGDHTVFVSGEDAEAKRVATALLEQLGHTDVLDLGGIESARGAETALAFWLRVRMALGHNRFNFKIAR